MILAVVLALAGCTSVPTATDNATLVTTSTTPTSSPTPTPTVNPDLELTITARATTEGGDAADLSLKVYRPISVDDPAAMTWRADLDAACRDELTYRGQGDPEYVYTRPSAAFIRSEVTVTAAPGSSWPAETRLGFEPFGLAIPSPSDFIITGISDSSLRCSVGNSLLGEGAGTRLMVFYDEPATTIDDRFASTLHGFWLFSEPRVDIAPLAVGTITDCEITLTDLGAQLVDASPAREHWVQTVTPQRCEVGFTF